MWHKKQRGRLGVVKEHRIALLRNLAKGLVEHGKIRTTINRARETSRFADKLITIAKKGDLHARRQIIAKLNSAESAKRLVDEIAPLFTDQAGGYTRVIRYDFRPGDGAQMAILEFTKMPQPSVEEEAKTEKSKKRKKKAKPEAEGAEEKKPSRPKPKAKTEETTKKPKTEAPETPEGQEEKMPAQEEPKKGGFLGGLRKFLTGE